MHEFIQLFQILGFLAVLPVLGVTYTETWDETKPAGSRQLNLGDDDIREHKRAIRERLATDHHFASDETGDTEIGYHEKTTFLVQGSDPTAVASAIILYAKDDAVDTKAHLYIIDEDSNIMQLTGLVGASNKLGWIAGMPGEVRMWSDTIATIPPGWVICDGNNGSPNLIAKFVRGVATAATDPGDTGGADTATLAEANLPAHTHSIPALSMTIDYDNSVSTGSNTLGGGNSNNDTVVETTDADTSGSAGSGDSFSILPTYHELAYIYKT